jgi:hypothetical protein
MKKTAQDWEEQGQILLKAELKPRHQRTLSTRSVGEMFSAIFLVQCLEVIWCLAVRLGE